MATLKEPKIIKDFITAEEAQFFLCYTQMMHRNNPFASNDKSYEVPNDDTSYYADALTESLLLKKHEFMEKELGIKLFPTYTYWRMYTYGSELKKHTDRNSCEISITLHLGSDGTPWPICFNDQCFELKPGEAAIYKGIEWPHYRKEPYKGDFYSQVFMHYVHADGIHQQYKFDKRPLVGLKK